jgi:hypothetical protein
MNMQIAGYMSLRANAQLFSSNYAALKRCSTQSFTEPD